MEYEIEDGFLFEPPVIGRPPRSAEQENVLAEVAKGRLSANAAAKSLIPLFYGEANSTPEQKVEQTKYIARLIRERRRL